MTVRRSHSHLNDAAADALMDYLTRNHGYYLAIAGRVGAYPCIRWCPSKESWELASVVGMGGIIHKYIDDDQRIREVIKSGPRVVVEPMSKAPDVWDDPTEVLS